MPKKAWRISLEPTRMHVTRTGVGQFTTQKVTPGQTVTPPKGSFPVIIAVSPRLRDDANGNAPATGAAEVEFIGRIKGSGTFISLGKVTGKTDFNSAGATPLPRFTCDNKKITLSSGGGATTSILVVDFTPGTANEVTRSDWVLSIEEDKDTFPMQSLSAFDLQLPWVFDDTKPILELSARLSVGGAVIADEKVNTPLQIPLTHEKIPEDLDNTLPELTFFGVRTIVPKSLSRTGVKIGSSRLLVCIHESVTDFLTTHGSAATIAGMKAGIQSILSDVGFPKIEIVAKGDAGYAAELTRFNGFFKRSGGMGMPATQFHATNLTNATGPSPKVSGSKAFLPNHDFMIDGEGAQMPFFEFFITLEENDYTLSELGLGEILGTPVGKFPAGDKLVGSPIVLVGGASSTTGIRNQLNTIEPADHNNLMANLICHEVGHTFGLRHGLTFDETSPYAATDSTHVSNSVMYIAENLQAPTPPATLNKVRLNFFGPVQRQAIRTAVGIK